MSTIDRTRQIDILVGPSQTNPLKALDMLPSVHSESADAFGIVYDMNPLRVRGQSGENLSRLSRTIEGLPIGINVPQFTTGNIIDTENLAEISLISGAIPPDKGLGFGNSAGALDQTILWPSSKFGVALRQSFGSENFKRTFARIDTGEFSTKTNLFVSGSYSEADKWRGSGGAERGNINVGLAQSLPGDTKFSLFGAYNNVSHNEYLPLTYAQATNNTTRGSDFNSSLTGNAIKDTAYFDYNRQKYHEYLVFSLLEFKPTNDSYLTFKPYYAGHNGYRLSGKAGATATASYINRTEITQEQIGFTAEYGVKLGPSLIKLGYWYQDILSCQPAAAQTNYSLTASGLTFKNWQMLNKFGSRTFQTPYVEVDNRFGKLRLNVGLKYTRIDMPEISGYNTTGLPNVSYDDVFGYNPTVKLQANSLKFEEWLPYVGMSYEFDERSNIRLNYGRNYAMPWHGNNFSTYSSNTAAFTSAGVSLQDLMGKLKLEVSDNVDIGGRYDNGVWYVAPTLFYGWFYDKQTMAYDSKVGLSYYQSNANAESMGVELETGITPVSGLTIFGSASYNRFTFNNNIQTASNTAVQSKGKQVADTPEFMGKIGVSYTTHGLTITPMMRYYGERYGDIENKEKVKDFKVVDLSVNYVLKKVMGLNEISCGLNITNLFNEKYIGIIRNQQDATQALSTTYYSGAPFTVVGSFGFKY